MGNILVDFVADGEESETELCRKQKQQKKKKKTWFLMKRDLWVVNSISLYWSND